MGMRRDGYPVTVELAAQLCTCGLRLRRLDEVLPLLPFLGLAWEDLAGLLQAGHALRCDEFCSSPDELSEARLRLYG